MIARRLLRLTDGQDLIEYSLLIGMLSVAIVFALKDTGTTVSGLYADAASVLSGDSGSEDPGKGNPNPGNPGTGNPGNAKPVGNPGNGNPGKGKP